MSWLIWILIAFGFMGAELFIPTGFVFLLIGLSFFVTGAAVAFGLEDPTWAPWALCLGCLISFISILRRPLIKIFKFDLPSSYEELSGDEVVITSDIAPGSVGAGELRGTHWSVRNVGSSPLTKGDRVKVIRVNGLTVEAQK